MIVYSNLIMRNLLVVFTTLIIHIHCMYQSAQNTTVEYPPQITSCSGNGVIFSDKCVCFSGFFGNQCTFTLKQYYIVGWPIVQYIVAVMFLLMFFLSLYIIYLIRKRNKLNEDFKGRLALRLSLYIMSSFAFYQFFSFIFWFIDPMGYLIPIWLITIWFSSKVIFFVLLKGLILSQWIEVFHLTTKAIKKAEKNQIITLPEIKKKLVTMNKFKTPFVVSMIVISIIQIAVVSVTHSKSRYYYFASIINFISLASFSLVFAIGYMVYGYRIYTLADQRIQSRIYDMTVKMFSYNLIGMALQIVYAIMLSELHGPDGQLAYQFLSQGLFQWPLTLMIQSIYVKFDPKKCRLEAIDFSGDSPSNTPSVDPLEGIKESIEIHIDNTSVMK